MNLKYMLDEGTKKITASNMILTDIEPYYEYDSNNNRTDRIKGYKYDVVCENIGYQHINVKIDGDRQVDLPEDYAYVEFEGLKCTTYIKGKDIEHASTELSWRASKISFLK